MDLTSVSDPNDLMASLAGRDESREIFGNYKKVNQNEPKIFVTHIFDDVIYECTKKKLNSRQNSLSKALNIELVSKELNHYGVIADLFRQMGAHSSRFVLFCSF